jgi:membrane protein YqaA with SNARE-associated domain
MAVSVSGPFCSLGGGGRRSLTVTAGVLRVDFWRFVALVALGERGCYVFIALALVEWMGK